jgi:hypothetical protein
MPTILATRKEVKHVIVIPIRTVISDCERSRRWYDDNAKAALRMGSIRGAIIIPPMITAALFDSRPSVEMTEAQISRTAKRTENDANSPRSLSISSISREDSMYF